jgi:putative hydrolase of the HAD superfamily
METPIRQTIRRLSRPLEPIPTDQGAELKSLPGIRAVLLDVYGTLFVSGSGEVGTLREAACAEAFRAALAAVGLTAAASSAADVRYLFEAIEASHAASRARGIDYPEVDIRDVWRLVVARLAAEAKTGTIDPEAVDEPLLAVEYECRANPVWPMPGVRDMLAACRDRGLVLGIVSNAQFFTRELFPALLGATLGQLGFARALEVFSYEHGRAKPGDWLFRRAAEALRSRGIAPAQAVYLGNDMLNDIMPAQRVGFRTALFAGDRRSHRPRLGDPRTETIVPDVTVTALGQLTECCMVL